ncbi:MAG: hypothetical protein K8U57_31860 [Planctomycetes bacterium]|nr:hypothetical protein [Planctomycetota bacterium]
MFRFSSLVLLVTVFATAAFSRADADFTAEKAKALIPQAAGMLSKELQDIAQSPNPSAITKPSTGYSLTWAILNYAPGEDAKKITSFQFQDEQVNPSKLAFAISGPKDKDGKYRNYASVIQPEYITDCTCKVNGNTATGTVTFKAPKAYEGKVEYTARKKGETWRIEEFRLPDLKITVAIGDDGTWVKK